MTGGGGGIGLGIAQRFAAAGAHVVVTDIDGAAAERRGRGDRARVGAGRAIGLAMDVTERGISAAGVRAHRARIRRARRPGLERGHRPARRAARPSLPGLAAQLRRQRDRPLSSGTRSACGSCGRRARAAASSLSATKNVPAPGKDFGAYSAAKAAETQLARILAIENGEHGIRVNVLHPDAVFRGTNLWSDEVEAQRAKAHGIDVEQIEEFYRKRNLLGARCCPPETWPRRRCSSPRTGRRAPPARRLRSTAACARRFPAEPDIPASIVSAEQPERTHPIDQNTLQALLESVRDGVVTPQAAGETLKRLPFEDLDFARADHHRELRSGFPEVILGLGKTPQQASARRQHPNPVPTCSAPTSLPCCALTPSSSTSPAPHW